MKYSMRGPFGLAIRIAGSAAILGACFATAGWTGAWHKPTSQVASPAADRLSAVAALDEFDAWAVGTRYLSSDGGVFLTLIEHWDGASWNVVTSPSPAGTGAGGPASILSAVAIDSPVDVWAVGSRSPGTTDPSQIPPSHGLIEHWNGSTWTVVPGPSSGGHTTALTAVATISRTAAWAIGIGTAGGHRGTVFMRWDGTSWRYLPSPAGTDLSGLVAISAHDIWVVGTRTARSRPTVRTVAEHWNGSKWTIVPTPNGFKGRVRDSSLVAAGASSSSSVWAVGRYQSGPLGIDSSTLVEHWGGAKWHRQPSPNGPGSPAASQLDAISALSRTSAWAVGSYQSNHGLVPLIERWNGVNWVTQPSQLQPGVMDAFLSGVAAIHSRYAWAVGEALNPDHQPITLIEKWNGASWRQVPSPNP